MAKSLSYWFCAFYVFYTIFEVLTMALKMNKFPNSILLEYFEKVSEIDLPNTIFQLPAAPDS